MSKTVNLKQESVKFIGFFKVSSTRKMKVQWLSLEEKSIIERKAEVLVKLRKYKLVKKENYADAICYSVNIPKEKEKAIVWCIQGKKTVGIALINHLYKVMEKKEIDKAIVIAEGRYTHAVKQGAKKKDVELLDKTFPAFNIFRHILVSKAEILSEKEKKKLFSQFKVQPYQMPQIKSTDPGVKVIGAKPGNVVRIIRKSATAGKSIAYRYVVE